MKMINQLSLLVFILALLGNQYYIYAQSKTLLFVGSYTEGYSSKGIYVFELDTTSGALSQLSYVDSIVNPSFLTLSTDGKQLYACTETKLERPGTVSAFRVNPTTGQLEFQNKQPAYGRNPVHVSVNKNNKFLVVSNYTDAGIMLYPLKKDGALDSCMQAITFKQEGSKTIKKRQEDAHIHAAIFSPNGKFLFAPDLGADQIWIFKFRPTKPKPLLGIKPLKTHLGAGPRHFIFHPQKNYAYCIEELSGTVTSYHYQNSQLRLIDRDFSYSKHQVSYGSADIHISPDGKFLYASNRWYDENTIAIFKINAKDGTLKLVDHQATLGDHPRSFALSPNGKFVLVANQATGNIVVFKRDETSGLLSPTPHEVYLNLPSSLKMYQY